MSSSTKHEYCIFYVYEATEFGKCVTFHGMAALERNQPFESASDIDTARKDLLAELAKNCGAVNVTITGIVKLPL